MIAEAVAMAALFLSVAWSAPVVAFMWTLWVFG